MLRASDSVFSSSERVVEVIMWRSVTGQNSVRPRFIYKTGSAGEDAIFVEGQPCWQRVLLHDAPPERDEQDECEEFCRNTVCFAQDRGRPP
jgi:hypothetical protein